MKDRGSAVELCEGDCGLCTTRHRSLFSSLTGGEVELLNSHKSSTHYKKGQALFHMGTRPLGVFCVSSGTIKVYTTGQDGKEQIIKVSAAGDLLGYKALISEHQYMHTAEALDDCVVCFIPKDDFVQLLKPGSDFYLKLLKAVCDEHGALSERMTQMAQMSVRQRLALALLMLKDTYGVEHETDGEVEINLSREDLSNIVGTATESLIRLLNSFKKEELIASKGRKIKILDPEGLMRVSTQ